MSSSRAGGFGGVGVAFAVSTLGGGCAPTRQTQPTTRAYKPTLTGARDGGGGFHSESSVNEPDF